jgi:hypothetical protein
MACVSRQDILSCTFNLFELLIRKIDKKAVNTLGAKLVQIE